MTDAQQPNREQLRAFRQVFWDAWQKAQAKLPITALEVRIVRVIEMHPEYHHFFNDMETFLERDFPADGGMNPYLHLSLHLAIEEQLAMKQPPEAAKLIEFCMQDKKMNRHDALHKLLEPLAETVHEGQRQGKEPDPVAYADRIRVILQS